MNNEVVVVCRMNRDSDLCDNAMGVRVKKGGGVKDNNYL